MNFYNQLTNSKVGPGANPKHQIVFWEGSDRVNFWREKDFYGVTISWV